ncbi:right-handed parallel beta-helix repeat-containing protein [Paracoccus sp. SY]|uniref:right-handed parallel beta-helix repeat-containing protein n=1 Tax=Paracoccus sp. SY TaxID=1330255 RepID=UPI000CD061DC|nr:right-handed parallel beta-helix repeat-containing protein [Paracoccus sp. SY]
MLLRDLLVALPGLVGTVGTPSRAQDIEVKSSQIVSPTASSIPETIASSVGIPTASNLTGDVAGDHQETGSQDPEGAGTWEEANNEIDPIEDYAVLAQDSGILSTARPTLPVPDDDAASLPSSTAISLASGQATVMAGRVATLLPSDAQGQIASVRILEGADWGHVSVNPDNSLALVLSETDQRGTLSFRYEVTYGNGKAEALTAKVKVVPGQQEAGWGAGKHYVLETDAEGRSIVEHGENHRKVYISADQDALSLEDIAKMEGIKVSAINGKWLAAHAEYGSSEATALDQTAGMTLWSALTGSKSKAAPSSHWLLLESGHSYDDIKFLVNRGTQGESALNPILISSYGEGERPIITKSQIYNTSNNANIVIRDLTFTDGLKIFKGKNFLLEEVSIRHDTLTAEDVDNFTLRNSDIIDVFRDESVSKGMWQPHVNRISGFYANDVDGLLIENNFVDHAGWADNYKANLSLSGGQPPSMYSHGLYLNYDNTDLTLRDNMVMRSASFAAQVRSGGVIENNLFLDNNAAVTFGSGRDKQTYGTGNYTLVLDNVITSGAHRDVTEGPRGALTMGAVNTGQMTTMIGNIIAHLADPNNASELLKKYVSHHALKEKIELFYDDTLIYNWIGQRDIERNAPSRDTIDQRDTGVLNETTIQKFAAHLLGKSTATIADLANYLRAQATGKLDGEVDSDVINAFFRAGFGLDTTLRSQAETLRFVPNDLADGIRWDNRMNWTTDDLPSNGDSIDLGGNLAHFGGQTLAVDHFDFGDAGHLSVNSGKLSVTGEMAAGTRGAVLETKEAGQIWIDGYRDSDRLEIYMTGGRMVNTGSFAGETEATVSQKAQLVLATSGSRFDLAKDSSLAVIGTQAKVGFDGTDEKVPATLQLHNGATLSFVADQSGLGKISEIRTGAFGETKVTSGIRLDGDLSVDLSAWGKAGGSWVLLDADQIIGSFDDISVTGLGKNRDALVRFDYVKDEVVLLVSDAGKGSGQIRTSSTGDADFIEYTQDAALKALWANLQAAMPLVTDDPI